MEIRSDLFLGDCNEMLKKLPDNSRLYKYTSQFKGRIGLPITSSTLLFNSKTQPDKLHKKSEKNVL